MFRASLCPSSGEQDRVLLHVVFCSGCTGCGCVELGRELCALCEGYCSTVSCLHCATVHRDHSRTVTFTQCTQLTTQLHTTTANQSQHNQCSTPYAAVHGLVLLMMGIMMPETCWDRSLIINVGLVVSCWFLSLHPMFMMHGHKNLKLKETNFIVVTC